MAAGKKSDAAEAKARQAAKLSTGEAAIVFSASDSAGEYVYKQPPRSKREMREERRAEILKRKRERIARIEAETSARLRALASNSSDSEIDL